MTAGADLLKTLGVDPNVFPTRRFALNGATATFDKNAGVPVPGLWVCNIFPDGHGDEPQQTSSAGRVQFDFGPASAYTPPAKGPYRIVITDSARKDDDKFIVHGLELADAPDGLGDYQARHTFWSLQFVERGIPAPPPSMPVIHAPMETSLRDFAWTMRGISWNPDAALYKIARGMALGYPLGPEFKFKNDRGDTFVGQLYANGIVYCLIGDWQHVNMVPWL
jgi:hypothetical protein